MDSNNRALRRQIVENLTRLRRFAFALTGTPHDADDLLQATVERVLKKGAPEEADLKRWMFRVAKNIWIDEMRARRVRVSAVQDGKIEVNECTDGEAQMLGKMTLAQVNGAMNKLPDEQRTVLSLVALEGCSYKQAAEILDMPIGTVMSRLARARKALADALNAGGTSIWGGDRCGEKA